MALGTYAVLDNENKVFEIIEMDVLDDIPVPYPDAVYVRVGEPTPTQIPTIGQTWDGEINEFI